jgi:hypothetical protein
MYISKVVCAQNFNYFSFFQVFGFYFASIASLLLLLQKLRTQILVVQVVEDGGAEESQDDAVEVDAEDDGVEESQDDAVEVEAEGSTDGAVLVNGNSSEEQWGTKNEDPSA